MWEPGDGEMVVTTGWAALGALPMAILFGVGYAASSAPGRPESEYPDPQAYGLPTNGTADIIVAGLTTYAVYRAAQTCGLCGPGPYTQFWLNLDSRAELAAGTNTDIGWSWASGTIR